MKVADSNTRQMIDSETICLEDRNCILIFKLNHGETFGWLHYDIFFQKTKEKLTCKEINSKEVNISVNATASFKVIKQT